MPPTSFCFAISASFTAEPVQPIIEFLGRRLNSAVDVRFAPYNQIIQTLLDPHSVFARNRHGMNVILLRLEDLGGDQAMEAHAAELLHLTRDRAEQFAVPLAIVLCPASPAFMSDPARARLQRGLCSRLEGWLDDLPGVQFLPSERVLQQYPVEAPHDPDADRLGHIPYSELYFCALGAALVRHAHAITVAPYKVIALDCDNTLWQGICGEDGPTGIVVDGARRALQEFMLEQREAGMLLALASKNNEQDVLDTFAANPQMPLELRHFVARRLNWEPKPSNLASLAAELGLGLDSFIFVDDSPKECAEMAGNAPEVLALPLPANIVHTPQFLAHVWAFDHPVVTEEDRQRNAYYAQSQKFGCEVKTAASLEEFVAGLQLDVKIAPVSTERLSRAAQLTQRTNQFNFTTLRRSERDIQGLSAMGRECFTVEVSDRFGSYGVTGVLILEASGAEITIDTFLLSCRVLGRGVEHRMLAWTGALAVERGAPVVVAHLHPTAKNTPAREFLHATGSDVEQRDNVGLVYRFDAERLRDLRWAAAISVPAPQRPTPAPHAPVRRAIDYAAIANELATPAQILEAMRRESGHAADRDHMTATERELAAIWSDLLKCPTVEVSDNFFDSGGHSLLAVLLIVRVREAFGIELPIDDVYSAALTLGELARKIETYRDSQLDPQEYEALLAEIEGMSDEEVQALLADEETLS